MKHLVFSLFVAVAAHASIGACNNATEFSPQPPTMATVDSPGGTYTPGCTAVDKTFTAFSYTNSTPVYTSGAYLGWGLLTLATVTAPYGSGNTAADTAVDFLPGGAYWEASVYNEYAYDTVTFDYTVQSGGMMKEASLNYTVSTSASGPDGINAYYVALSICPGQATFVSGCANEQTTYTGALQFTPTNIIGAQESIYFYADGYNNSGAFTQITSIENDFYDTPEPSTFVLFGAGLAAACLKTLRKQP